MDRLERVKSTFKQGDHITALRLAAAFKRPSPIIAKAWSAYRNPSFYAQLGHDVAALIEAGIAEVGSL